MTLSPYRTSITEVYQTGVASYISINDIGSADARAQYYQTGVGGSITVDKSNDAGSETIVHQNSPGLVGNTIHITKHRDVDGFSDVTEIIQEHGTALTATLSRSLSDGAEVTITQTDLDNGSDNLTAEVEQTGHTGALANIHQSGVDNLGSITQVGSWGEAHILQSGVSGLATIRQSHTSAHATIEQSGNGTTAEIDQINGNSSATIMQSGEGYMALINQTGEMNSAYIMQQ